MGMRQGFFSVFFALAAAAMLVAFQNCSQVHYALTGDQSLSGPKVPELAASEGGEIYDGKPRILHHYVPGFQCEGRPQPESILFSQDDTNWRLIQNSPEKCAVQDKVPVTGVVYNSGTNQALYLGKTYVPPIPFYVDASEDPNLPDIKLEDGVCENTNNKCSLLAATQQAGVVSYTADSVVEIPSATYLLTRPLELKLSVNDHSVHLRGPSNGVKPVLDGKGVLNQLFVSGTSGTVIVEQLRFINGRLYNHPDQTAGTQASSAITLDFRFRGALTILDSDFSNNRDAPVVHAGPAFGRLTIRRSHFINNQGSLGTVRAYGSDGILVEDSMFTNNNYGIYVFMVSDLMVNRSTFSGNNISGLTLEHCRNCVVKNSTIYNNGSSGLDVYTVEWPEPEASPTIINSTIVQNGQSGANPKPNILVNFRNTIHKLNIINSVVATNGLGNSNCMFSTDHPFQTYTIEATNSLFDDSSCEATGVGNITGVSPQLGAFGDHGGFNFTLLPLSGSPLIDAGDNNFCPVEDQRGQPRPVDKVGAGSKCDIGAIEVQ